MECYNLYRDSNFAPSHLSVARFRKALARARLAAEKTNQLLDASRVTLNQISRDNLRLAPESISGILKRVIEVLRPFALERRVELAFNNEMHGNADRVMIDRLSFEMMVFNLVDNAIKYSRERTTVHIKLSLERDHSIIQVTDYGQAINPENKAAIFVPFIRRRTGLRNDARPGTGLGLPVAKQIVEAHGGVLAFSSRPQSDGFSETTFIVRIPRVLPMENRR
jgi:signal transduction histidine kinase